MKMGVNSKVGVQGDMDEVSKYHQEKMAPNPSGVATGSTNDETLPPHGGGQPHGLVYPTMENPMMAMSGGKPVPGGNGELDSQNAMMPMSGSNPGAEVPTQGDVMKTNPQGHKQAPLAKDLYAARGAHQKASKSDSGY
jgi:hypothetical protein